MCAQMSMSVQMSNGIICVTLCDFIACAQTKSNKQHRNEHENEKKEWTFLQ